MRIVVLYCIMTFNTRKNELTMNLCLLVKMHFSNENLNSQFSVKIKSRPNYLSVN